MLALSDQMQDGRRDYSHKNPDVSSNEFLYGGMRRDAEQQFIAASDGRLTADDATRVPATSTGPFINTVMSTPPENGHAAMDAVSSAGIGLSTQMLYGNAPGNPFHDTDPKAF
ncbi:MAG TPA: hypothetical protein VGG28_23695 [Kofleriaceae bacterium]